MKKVFLLLAALVAANLSQAQWEPDVRLTNDPAASWTPVSSNKPIAVSGDSIHVVWQEFRDGNAEIYYKRSTDAGTSWGEDTRLSNALGNSYDASLALSGTMVHVVWGDFRNGSDIVEIYYKRSEDGGESWGEDTRLTFAGSWSESPSIAIGDSVIHIVWYDWRDAIWDWGYEIYYKRSMDGGLTWGPDTRLTNDIAYSGYPCIAVSGQTVHVVWEDTRKGNGEVYYKRSDDGGLNWGPDTQLTDDPADSWDPVVAVNDSVVHVVWMDMRDGSAYEVYYKRSTDGGITWDADTRLTNASASSEYPTIAALGTMVHVTWGDKRDMNYEVYYKRSDDAGLTWEEDTRLTNAFAESNYPFVAVSDSAVHVIWDESRDGNEEIYYKRNPTGNVIVGTENLSLDNSGQEFNMFPNPASSIVHIQITDNPTGKSMLTIGNILGETLITRPIRMGEAIVDVSILQNGIYFVEIATQGKQVESQKLIIRK
ncbi:MAG: T9SS C-terminal target domain-containing protein [Bacteroidetes bacterium]|nr:MAG: T9SS C-terminal target domain-containing protein [Bacteroidota bacterium]